VGGTGSKKGFIEYYLPRNSSYLIYEYQRPLNQVCHVMIQSDGRGAKYRFIDAPYHPEFYIAENSIPRDSASVTQLYRPEAEPSKLMGVDDYCNIIQCQPVSSGKKWLRPLQIRFAMAAAPITHIEKVISSVIEKIGDFDTIKQMLIDISRDKLSQNLLDREQDKTPFQLNKNDIDAWLADLNAVRELEDKREDFDALLQTISSLKDTLNELSHLHALALREQKTNQTELTAISQSLTELKQQRAQLEKDYEQQLEPKHAELREVNKYIDDLDFKVQNLEKQKLDYEQQDAESFAIKASLLTKYQQQQKDIKEEIDALENESKQINLLYEKQLSDLKHRHTHQIQKFAIESGKQKRNELELLSKAEALYQKAKDQCLNDKDSRLKPADANKSQFTIDLEISRARLNSIPVSNVLQQQLNKTQQALETIRQETDLAIQNQLSANDNYSSALATFLEFEQQLKDKNTALRVTEESHGLCLKRLSPEHGSLQSFLETEVEDWSQNIGRVIAPELLERTDLDPQQLDSLNKSLYGLQIDLDVLADRANMTADKASLEQEELRLSEQRKRLKLEIEQTKSSLNTANKSREQCLAEKNKAKQQVQRHHHTQDNLQSEATGLDNQIRAEKEKIRVEIEADINRLSQGIADSERTLQTIEKDFVNEQKNLHSDYLSRKGMIQSDTENTIIAINTQIESEKSLFKLEKQRLEQQLTTDLNATGSDDTIVERSKALVVLKTKEQDALKSQQLDKEYQAWLTNKWLQHPNFCQQIIQHKQQLTRLEDEIKQSEVNYKNKKSSINRQISGKKTDQDKTQSLLTQLTYCTDQLKVCQPVLKKDLPDYAADTLFRLTRDTVQQRKQHEIILENGKRALLALFSKHNRSCLAEAWQQALDSARGTGDYFQAELLEIEQPLINVLQMVAHVKQVTIQQIDTHAFDVNAFYRHLRQFERVIKATGADLSRHVSEEKYFDALGEITVKIRSKMNDLEYWQALKSFGDNYDEYKNDVALTGNNEIPNTLIEAMAELTSILPATGFKIKHLALFDIEFSIMENGQIKHARNARELKDVSSTGLSYLALITFFTGVTSMLRKQDNTVICWPIDELGDLAPENIEAMMSLLKKHNIHIMSATPIADRHVLSLFNRRYLLDKQKIHEVKLPESKLEMLLGHSESEETNYV